MLRKPKNFIIVDYFPAAKKKKNTQLKKEGSKPDLVS